MPPYDLSDILTIGISSRALFDLEEENRIFQKDGLEKYSAYQLANEKTVLKRGTAFSLIQGLLALNRRADKRLVEVIIMSKNSPDTGLRIFNTIQHYGLDITRAAMTGGEPLSPYLDAFDIDLFLSKSVEDVQAAIDAGVAAALLYDPPSEFDPDVDHIRIALDADAVVFNEDSEVIYKQEGPEAFFANERENADKPLQEGPFAQLLKTLSKLQHGIDPQDPPVRIAIVTARSSPAHERVIKTLRAWGVREDAAFFLGGISKDKVLKAFRAHIFFDDQEVHLGLASVVVPSGRVPYPTGSGLPLDQKPEQPAIDGSLQKDKPNAEDLLKGDNEADNPAHDAI